MTTYDYIGQNIVASTLVQPHDNDSFYNPVQNHHNGFAADGNWYVNGVLQAEHPQASWFIESTSTYRGSTSHFPNSGIILLSPVALTILDQSTPTSDPNDLPLWMQFLLADKFALANNFNDALNGWTPAGLAYADGVLSVIYNPDPGNQVGGDPTAANSIMVVTVDFSQDSVYLDVAI